PATGYEAAPSRPYARELLDLDSDAVLGASRDRPGLHDRGDVGLGGGLFDAESSSAVELRLRDRRFLPLRNALAAWVHRPFASRPCRTPVRSEERRVGHQCGVR